MVAVPTFITSRTLLEVAMVRERPTDFYKVLGVRPDASAADIKHAYRELARSYHPDQAKDISNADAEEQFKRINQAYRVLSDREKRSRYDRWGHRGLQLGGSPGRGVVFTTGFNRSPQSKRSIIEERINQQERINLQQFAVELDVKVVNLRKILQVMIDKEMVDATINNNWFVHS